MLELIKTMLTDYTAPPNNAPTAARFRLPSMLKRTLAHQRVLRTTKNIPLKPTTPYATKAMTTTVEAAPGLLIPTQTVKESTSPSKQ